MLVLYVFYTEHVSSFGDLYGAYHRILLRILSMFCVSAPPPCPARQCVNICQHGYQVDNNGCATCTCIQGPGKYCNVTFNTLYMSMAYSVFSSMYVEYVSSCFYICTTYQQFMSRIYGTCHRFMSLIRATCQQFMSLMCATCLYFM
jgi:hypothetical protein